MTGYAPGQHLWGCSLVSCKGCVAAEASTPERVTLTDEEVREFERIEDTGETQGLAWRVHQLVAAREQALREHIGRDLIEKNADRAMDTDGEYIRLGDALRIVVRGDQPEGGAS